MNKDIHIGKELNKKDVFVPHVDEVPIPCPNGYSGSDCVYLSERVDIGYFGLDEKSPITDFFNAVIEKMKTDDMTIRKLNNRICKLEDKLNN